MSNILAADGKRLTSIFQSSSAQATQGNDALRYRSPTEPPRASQSQVQAAQSAAQAAPSPANAVVFNTTVSLYKFDSAARKHVQMGTSTSNVIGCVLVGAEVTYSVLFYGSDKATICEVPLKAWKPIVQPKNYLNFYDDKGSNWSAKFASDETLIEFMKQVFLIKIHVEIWSPTRSLDANSLLKEDLGAAALKAGAGSDDAAAPVAQGDRVAVEFKCWRVVGNAKATPADVVAKYPPFEKTNDGDQRKFRVGSGSERIKALEEGVVGMKRGGKRMILAPPGKTNGQEWYLLEVTLVRKSSKKEGNDRRASEAPAQSAPQEAEQPRRKESRRKTSPPVVTEDPVPNGSRGDIVRYEDDAAKDDLASRIRELEKQLHDRSANPRQSQANDFMAQQQQQHQQQQFTTAAYPGASPAGVYTPFGSLFSPAPQAMMSSSGRPLDGLVMELHAKVDYLIRMAPAGGSGVSTSFGGAVGATDVQSVLRGVERLAGENERLLLQINSQNQQYAAYEKRCEELLKQNQRLQDEKRVADEKYQSIASLQMNYNAEMSSLTSARDAAITHANRLHNEYQQLYTAFHQKQQLSSENDEQRNALEFERQSRARIEKELQKELQTKSLVEQELTLVKKQLEVVTKMKDSELLTRRQEMEAQYKAAIASQQQAMDERVKTVTAEHQQQAKQWQAQVEAYKNQTESVQGQLAAAKSENATLVRELEAARAIVTELEASHATGGLADDEKRIYVDQIELLHQQMKAIEADRLALMQQQLNGGGGDEALAAAQAKEDAAQRTLEMAEQLKREAQAMVGGQDARAETVTLFKEAVNEMFFRFQDVFEDAANAATPLEGKQVLTAIRKVLKQSTKDVLGRLQEEQSVQPAEATGAVPAPVPAPVVVAATAATVAAVTLATVAEVEQQNEEQEEERVEEEEEEEDKSEDDRESESSNDEPPPPPDMEEVEPAPADDAASIVKEEEREEEEPTTAKPEADDAEEQGEEDESAAGDDDLLFGAASAGIASLLPRRMDPSDVSEDEDDAFED